ncbi:MAG: HAD family hydrolase [Acidobacteria bacterium]|nr:HAD family hydrolase [Acidobacteriota bacterium]
MNPASYIPMKKYQAILFDLYDTLVDLRVEQFPLVTIGGQERRSTSGVIYQALQEFYNHIGFDEFFQAFMLTYLETEELRKQSYREILAEERFRRLLQRMGVESPPLAAIKKVVGVHMDAMFAVMECPPSRRRVLEMLKRCYRLGLVSNFDHPPTVFRVLQHYDLYTFFDTVVISGEAGWRKPHKEIFSRALAGLGISPEEALFVGDTPYADIVGPKELGMDVAWLDHQVVELDPTFPRPDYTIHDLEELLTILPVD